VGTLSGITRLGDELRNELTEKDYECRTVSPGCVGRTSCIGRLMGLKEVDMGLVSDIGALFGLLVTAASVLFAIFVYRRERDKEAFSKFRLSLVDLRSGLVRLIELLSEGSLSEIGVRISGEIRRILPDNATKNDLVSLLNDKTRHDFIVTAIYLALQNSQALSEIREEARELKRIPFEHESHLPLIATILDLSLFHSFTAISYSASSEAALS